MCYNFKCGFFIKMVRYVRRRRHVDINNARFSDVVIEDMVLSVCPGGSRNYWL